MALNYELVSVITKDGIKLHGLLSVKNSKNILINIHGTASNFYEEGFVHEFARELPKKCFSVLSTNNRGAYAYEPYQKTGASTEIFEDCVTDIDAWIEFALKLNYRNIFLSGHSLGTEKVVYHMNKGKHKEKIKAVILLAPSDSIGYLEQNDKNLKKNLMKANELIKKREGDFFLSRYAYSKILPKSAESFVNFLNKGSELSKALPFHKGRLIFYRRINVPILVVIGDLEEYTVIPIKEALELLKRENPNTEIYQLHNCNHDFEGKEKELTRIVKKFLLGSRCL